MGKSRLGKRERKERQAQWDLVKTAKTQLVADNLANLKSLPTSKGMRQSNLERWLGSSHSFHGVSNMSRPSSFGADGTKYGVK